MSDIVTPVPGLSEDPGARGARDVAWNTFHSTPAGRAIGLDVLDRGTGFCTLAVHCAGPARQAGLQRVHPGAVTIAVDQCLGSAASGERPRHLVTIELRIDWHGPVPPEKSILCSARVIASNARSVMVGGEIRAGLDGPIVAHATGQFLLGASAGGFSDRKPGPAVDLGAKGWGDFDAFLGLVDNDTDLILPPAPHRIGSTYLPALHGGVTAASLQQAILTTAERWRPDTNILLLSTTTQFLNAGAALQPLFLTTNWVRLGRSVSMLEAKACQAGRDEPVAVAQATVLAAEGSDRAAPRIW